MLGLRWKAIDFEHKTISINHKILVVNKNVYLSDTLKTKTSNRTLPLIPAIETDLIELINRQEENRRYFGNTYNQKYLDYVLVDECGKLIYPDHLTKVYGKMLKNNKLKIIRLHDLRHSCASLMLANGVQMKQIQEWLGHADFSTTADIYSHLDFSSKIQSANTIANVLNMAVEPQDKNRTVINVATPQGTDMINTIIQEMTRLGIADYNEYLNYQNSLEKNESVKVKNGMCM